MTAYLQFDQVSKVFPGVKALNGVSFAAHAGQVHGLLGENGAGKSTLLKILGGQYKPDGGRLLVDGRECRFGSAKDAIQAGIAVIHQELQYVPELTVSENVLLGRMPTRFGLLDKPKAHRIVAEKLAAIGVDLAPGARLADLSIAQRQMVEICKAIMQDAQVIAFDEPTSSLSHRETEILFPPREGTARRRPHADLHLAPAGGTVRAVRRLHHLPRRPQDRHAQRDGRRAARPPDQRHGGPRADRHLRLPPPPPRRRTPEDTRPRWKTRERPAKLFCARRRGAGLSSAWSAPGAAS